MKLAGRCAIITGASQGLGLGNRETICFRKARMSCYARAMLTNFIKCQKELTALARWHDVKVLAKAADVSKLEQIEALMADYVARTWERLMF